MTRFLLAGAAALGMMSGAAMAQSGMQASTGMQPSGSRSSTMEQTTTTVPAISGPVTVANSVSAGSAVAADGRKDIERRLVFHGQQRQQHVHHHQHDVVSAVEPDHDDPQDDHDRQRRAEGDDHDDPGLSELLHAAGRDHGDEVRPTGEVGDGAAFSTSPGSIGPLGRSAPSVDRPPRSIGDLSEGAASQPSSSDPRRASPSSNRRGRAPSRPAPNDFGPPITMAGSDGGIAWPREGWTGRQPRVRGWFVESRAPAGPSMTAASLARPWQGQI